MFGEIIPLCHHFRTVELFVIGICSGEEITKNVLEEKNSFLMVWIICNFYSQSTFHNVFSIFCIDGGDGSRGLCC